MITKCERDHQSPAETSYLLSIVMPAYNEVATLKQVVAHIQTTGIKHELIVVDDGSTDMNRSLLGELEGSPAVRIVRHSENRGKGAALRTGFERAIGDVVLIQDADLEYDPGDYAALMEPFVKGGADVVYGSRFLPYSVTSIPRVSYWANRLITWLFNRATGQNLTDVETCYKAFRRETLQQILPLLEENGFGIEIELAARVSKVPGVRIAEVPIRYRARTRHEGKKIRWIDGIRALWCILRYR